MKSISFFLFLFLSLPVFSQHVSVAEKYAATIDSNTIKKHVYKLASPEFQGRETGTDGNMKAAAYIADQFRSFQIPALPGDSDYYQELAFTTIKWSTNQITVNGK